MTRCARLGYAIFAAACLLLTPAIQAREWSHQGQRIQADLEALRADKVVLRQGVARLEIALAELSAADRQFVEPLRRPRVWTNRAGKEISASLVGRDGDRVIVQKDERELRIAIDQLCDQDRLFVSQVFGDAQPSESPASSPSTNPPPKNSAPTNATNTAEASLPPDLRGERVWRRWNGPSIRGSLLKVRDEMAWFTVGNSTVPVPLAQLKPEERAAISLWQSVLESQLAAAEAARAEARAQKEAIELAARQAAEEQERLARQKAALERAEAERIAAAERAAQAAAPAVPSPAPAYTAPASPANTAPAANASPVAVANSPMPGYAPMPGYSPMPGFSPMPGYSSAPNSTPSPNYASAPSYSPPSYSPPGYSSSTGSPMPASPSPNYSSTDTAMAYSPPSTYSSNSSTSSTSSYDSSDDSSSGGSIRLRPRFFKGLIGIVTLVCTFFAFLYRKLSGGEEEQQQY